MVETESGTVFSEQASIISFLTFHFRMWLFAGRSSTCALDLNSSVALNS